MTSKKIILVIDDDSAVRDAFEIALSDLYQVELATGGEEGLASVQKIRPDLIFLDMRMPGMNGVETLRRLHQMDATLQVYVVTAFAQEYMAGLRAAKAEGIRFQLAAKPLSTAQIRDIASAALAREEG